MTSDTAIWASLPVPAVIIDAQDRIADINPAAETFFNASLKALHGAPVWDKLAVDAPLEDALERARANSASLFKDQMLQVVLNLLKNAAEAAGAGGGTIWLRSYYEHSFRLRRSDGSGQALPLQFEIIDDGPGLPPEIAADIFDPFVSGRENGTGLGLALVSKIISDLGGWISVESVPGRTVFRISLAVAPDDGAPADPTDTEQTEESA